MVLKNQGAEFGKIAGKKILTKSADTTGYLIGYKIADKITSLKVKDKLDNFSSFKWFKIVLKCII